MRLLDVYRKKQVATYSQVLDEDYDYLNQWKWSLHKSGNSEYAKRVHCIDGKYINYYMHRVVLERMLGKPLLPSEYSDHIDHNGLNNQRDNLRVSSASQNNMNSRIRKNSTSGYKGICWL